MLCSQALYGFEYDKNRDQNKENAVRKTRECLDSAISEENTASSDQFRGTSKESN